MWRPREIRLVQVKTGFHPSFGSGLIKGDNPTPQVEHVSVFDQSGNISDLIKLDTNIDSVCLRFFFSLTGRICRSHMRAHLPFRSHIAFFT
jgi:hypothetical protein